MAPKPLLALFLALPLSKAVDVYRPYVIPSNLWVTLGATRAASLSACAIACSSNRSIAGDDEDCNAFVMEAGQCLLGEMDPPAEDYAGQSESRTAFFRGERGAVCISRVNLHVLA